MRMLILALLLILAGCSSTSVNPGTQPDPGPDTGSDAQNADVQETGSEAGPDAGPDVAAEVGPDVEADVGSDVTEAGDATEDTTPEGGPDASCTDGTSKCVGNKLDSCVNGSWFEQTCQYVCSDGGDGGASACIGNCHPGDKQCSGNDVQTCDATGQWQTTSQCPWAPNATGACSGKGVCSYQCNPGWDDCDLQAGNGCEVHTSVDAQNCGVCGKKCCGSCSSGTCVASLVNIPTSYAAGPAFDVTDSNLYWASNGNTVYTSTLDGATVTTVASNQNSIQGIKAYSGGLLWASVDGVFQNGTSLTSTTAYWVGYSGSTAYWVPAPAGSGLQSTQGTVFPAGHLAPWMGVTFVGSWVYWVDYTDTTAILRSLLPTGSPSVFFAPGGGTVWNMRSPVSDGTWIFFLVDDSTHNGVSWPTDIGIWKILVGGGTPVQMVTLSQAMSQSVWISTDGTNVYYIDGTTNPYAVKKISISTPSPVQIGTVTSPFGAPRVNSSCVYECGVTLGHYAFFVTDKN